MSHQHKNHTHLDSIILPVTKLQHNSVCTCNTVLHHMSINCRNSFFLHHNYMPCTCTNCTINCRNTFTTSQHVVIIKNYTVTCNNLQALTYKSQGLHTPTHQHPMLFMYLIEVEFYMWFGLGHCWKLITKLIKPFGPVCTIYIYNIWHWVHNKW